MRKKKDIGISRRKILAGLGTIGVASAGAGLGTSAYFSDTESFDGNMITAGELDLGVSYDSAYNFNTTSNDTVSSGFVTDTGQNGVAILKLTDMKPGDEAEIEFCFQSVNNPAYIWFCGLLKGSAQGSINEPEQAALNEFNYTNVTGSSSLALNNSTYYENVVNETDDKYYDMGSWGGQLAQQIQMQIGYSSPGNSGANAGPLSGPDYVIQKGSVGNLMANGLSIPLNAGTDQSGNFTQVQAGNQTAFNASEEFNASGPFDNPCLNLHLSVPENEKNNIIQSDSVTLAIGFHASQARHNTGSQSPCGFDGGDGTGDDGGFGGLSLFETDS